jgi:hypothetical protein
MARVSVEVPAELVETIRETVLLLHQATAESLHAALRTRAGEEAPAETSNRCWRGELPLERVQQGAEEVLALDALLRSLDR